MGVRRGRGECQARIADLDRDMRQAVGEEGEGFRIARDPGHGGIDLVEAPVLPGPGIAGKCSCAEPDHADPRLRPEQGRGGLHCDTDA